MARWRDFRRAEAGFEGFAMAHQVHGADLAWHSAVRGWTIVDGVDGHLTDAPGVMLQIIFAECLPVYLLVPGRAMGLLHAGRRGTAAGILERGVAALARHALLSSRAIVAHLGVRICGACYEVGCEVMTGCGLQADSAGPWHLYLRA